MYERAESLIKVCGSLTTPFSFKKEIRRGCPLSGLLYTIAIEPLLIALRKTLPNSLVLTKWVWCRQHTQMMCQSLSALMMVLLWLKRHNYAIFSRASTACLNTKKSQCLWVGRWTGRSDSPLQFSWNSEGLPFVGLHLGNTVNYVGQNWVKCKDKPNKTLLSWSRLSPSMSYKGKVIIAN